MEVLSFDCFVAICEYLSPSDLARVSAVNTVFNGACKVEHIWRRHSLQRWTFCDITQVGQGPERWRRYFYSRVKVDTQMEKGRPGFDYRARTLRGPESAVTHATFMEGEAVNWEEPLLPLLISCYENGTIVAWNANKGESLWTSEVGPVCCVAVHPRSTGLFVGLESGVVRLISTGEQDKWQTKSERKFDSRPLKIGFLSEKEGYDTKWTLFVGLDTGDIVLCQDDLMPKGVLKGNTLGTLCSLEVSKSNLIAACGTMGNIGIWSWKLLKKDFESGKSPPPHISLNRGRQPDDIQIEHEELLVFMRPLLPRIRFSSASLQWLPQQKGLLAVMCGSHVELWDISQKLVECEKCYGTWRAPDEGYHLVNPVTVHNASASIKCAVPSGGYLVIGDTNGQLQVLDIASGEMVQHFQDHKGPVTGLFGDAFRLVSCSEDYSLRVYRWLKKENKTILDSKYTLLGGSVAMKTHSGFNAVLCCINCCVGVAGNVIKVYTFGS